MKRSCRPGDTIAKGYFEDTGIWYEIRLEDVSGDSVSVTARLILMVPTDLVF